uniref:Helitron helicase-like domain-containing protein n=1 Tax=Amphimedon queenslandica TaxID=400682 RepID=A0A1X7UYL0_AMPQE
MAFPTLFPTGAVDYNGIRSHRVQTADYFTHLMKHDQRRFAKHPHFCFFALNTEICSRGNETGQFYMKQHPGKALLTLHDRRDVISWAGERFSKKVLHHGTSQCGTKQYCLKERNKLIAMLDTLRLPTIFFAHSAADHQWPELVSLICPEDQDDK